MKRYSMPQMLHILFVSMLYSKNIAYSCALNVQDISALVRWSLPWSNLYSNDWDGEIMGEITG